MKYTCSVAMGPVGDLIEIANSQAVCIDKFGVDGHRELAEAGVIDDIVVPWVFEGLGFDASSEKKKVAMQRFAETYIHSGWQD